MSVADMRETSVSRYIFKEVMYLETEVSTHLPV
jgi:hypothetical protein